MYCRQIALRLAMALMELGALPATYRRITMTVVTGGPPASALFRLRATFRLRSAVRPGIRRDTPDIAFAEHRRSGGWRVCAALPAQLTLPFVRGRLARLIITGI